MRRLRAVADGDMRRGASYCSADVERRLSFRSLICHGTGQAGPNEFTGHGGSRPGEKKWRSVEASGRFWSMGFLSQLSQRAVGIPRECAVGRVARLTASLVRQRSRHLTRLARPVANLVLQCTWNPTRGPESNSRTISRSPTKGAGRRSRGGDGVRRLRGKFHGEVGRMSFGAFMPASMITDCSPSPPESSSIRCWHSFPQLRLSSHSTD